MNNRGDIKREAKGLILRGKKSPIMACLLVVAVSFFINLMVTYFSIPPLHSETEALTLYMEALQAGDVNAALAAIQGAFPQPTTTGAFVRILGQLLLTLLTAGFTLFCMGIRQGREMSYATLIEGLGKAGRIIWCSILMYIKISLWTLLFLVPGIIAAYRYRFAIYNLLTDDRLTAGQAIRLSCLQTRGMKGELFVLDLSFLGWTILSSFTMGILNFWLTPYRTFADLAYYDEAQLRLGRTIPQSSDPGNPSDSQEPWNQ